MDGLIAARHVLGHSLVLGCTTRVAVDVANAIMPEFARLPIEYEPSADPLQRDADQQARKMLTDSCASSWKKLNDHLSELADSFSTLKKHASENKVDTSEFDIQRTNTGNCLGEFFLSYHLVMQTICAANFLRCSSKDILRLMSTPFRKEELQQQFDVFVLRRRILSCLRSPDVSNFFETTIAVAQRLLDEL